MFVSYTPDRLTTYSGFSIRTRFHDARAAPRFFAYLFRGPGIRQLLSRHGGGTNISNLNQGILARLEVPLPPLPEQRRIASILGAYDDLIEVNRRRIAVLEEMARRLFEEWFVNLRGLPSPSDWTSGVTEALVAFDPPTRVPSEGYKPFVPMSALPTASSIIGSHELRTGNSGAKFQNGDTLFARITPCLENGKTGLVRGLPGSGIGFGSTEFIVMRGKTAGSAFTYLLGRSEPFRAHAQKSMSGATGRQRVRVESLKSYPVLIPDEKALAEFEQVAMPFLDLAGVRGEATLRLVAARDLLLPRLVSGDLPIVAAEQELADAA